MHLLCAPFTRTIHTFIRSLYHVPSKQLSLDVTACNGRTRQHLDDPGSLALVPALCYVFLLCVDPFHHGDLSHHCSQVKYEADYTNEG